MTFEQGVDHIRSVNRVCRGPNLFSQFLRTELETEGNAALSPYNHQAAYALKRKLEIFLRLDDWQVNSVTEMAQRLVFLIYARPDVFGAGRCCGFDYNNFVISNPWDGKIYETTCPLCGTQDKYQAPVIQLEGEA